jgi:hypothetical protein
MVLDLMQAVLLGDLLLVERPLGVLLIGEDQDRHILQVLHRGNGTSLMTILNSSVLAMTSLLTSVLSITKMTASVRE